MKDDIRMKTKEIQITKAIKLIVKVHLF